MQPLDVAFMGPFKMHYAAAAEEFIKQHPGRVISLYNVTELIGLSFIKSATMSVAINGFKRTGIYPLNRSVFSDEDFAPSEVTDVPMVDHSEPNAIKTKVETTTLSADANFMIDATVDSTFDEHVSEASPNASFQISPSQIIPLPKGEMVRGIKRKRKVGKAVDVTSDNYRRDLAATEAVKQIKSIKAVRIKASRKRTKQRKCGNDSIDVLCEICGSSFSDSFDGQGWMKCLKCLGWFHVQCADDDINNNLCRSCV